jgi:hypothetical protein
VFERNVVVVDASSAPSRDGWFGGRPCAGEGLPAGDRSPHCTYDTFDNFFDSVVLRNVYYNTTAMSTNPTFPGGCNDTELGACGAKPPGRTSHNGGCSCRSFEEWRDVGEDSSSLRVDPLLSGPLKLVTSAPVLALGIEVRDLLAHIWLIGP